MKDLRLILNHLIRCDDCRFSYKGLDGGDVGPVLWNGIAIPVGSVAHACVAESVDAEVFALQSLR
jgi:hypothetical protein